MPERIQRKRTAGWRMPANTISVTRPGKYGNPYCDADGCAAPEDCVRYFREWLERIRFSEPKMFAEYIQPLRGKNLACWCKVGAPCHADILLEVANGD
jgi:hypothetical protein